MYFEKAVTQSYDSTTDSTHNYPLFSPLGESVLEVIAAFEKASGNKIPYEFAPRRPGDVAETYAACGLAEGELGWKAKLNLDDMCEHNHIFYTHSNIYSMPRPSFMFG